MLKRAVNIKLWPVICRYSLLLSVATFTSTLSAQHSLDSASGKALFERNWVTAPASTTASDGLGPFYNARSCNACHPAGGPGNPPQALTLLIDDAVYGQQLQTLAIAGLAPEVQVVFGYQSENLSFADGSTFPAQRLQVQLNNLRYGDLNSGYSARRAPSLFGLAALAQVPESTLEALADPEDRDGDGISGRLSRLVTTNNEPVAAGRFGWKAQVASLPEQVTKAFLQDIGMASTSHPYSHGDCTAEQIDCVQLASATSSPLEETEVSETVVKLVLAYAESLLIKRGMPRDSSALTLYNASGCQGCHVPELEPGLLAFTDLLLHDMGEGLADSLADQFAAPSEWRTVPLVNLRLNERFLHDGRAATLEEAILWHGGEATASREAFRALKSEEKQRLIEFLFAL